MMLLVCGKASETNDTELKSLTDVNLNEIPKYPWVATIFLVEDAKHLYICSGSLITASHVLSGMYNLSFIFFSCLSVYTTDNYSLENTIKNRLKYFTGLPLVGFSI